MLKPVSEIKINSLYQFKNFVEETTDKLQAKQVLVLSGPMGAGKTQFVQFLMKHLGGELPMSPTFAIHNNYVVKNQKIHHIDLYRIENDTDLESTGFWEVFDEEKAWVLIEWGDRLGEQDYPLNWSYLQIDIQPIEGEAEGRKVSVYSR